MPYRETRQSIERAIAAQKRERSARGPDPERMMAALERHLAQLRETLDPEQFATLEAKFRDGMRKISVQILRKGRRPGEGSMPALVEPPRGPRPLSGGAAVALEFDD